MKLFPPILGGRGSPSPTFTFDAATGALPAGSTFTRASGATRFNSSGALEAVSADTPRFEHDTSGNLLGLLLEEASTNLVTNPRAEGAVAGTPGTAPTGWSVSGVGGWSSQIVGTGTEDGIPYIDVRVFDTAGAGASNNYRFNVMASIDLAATTTYTASAYLRVIAGDPAPFQFRIGIGAGHSPAADLNVAVPTTAALKTQRRSTDRTTTTAETATFVWVGMLTPTGVGDVTFRIGAPQLETLPFASSVILPPVSTPGAATRARDVVTLPDGLWAGDSDSVYLDGKWTGTLAGNAMSLAMQSASGTGDGTSTSINALGADFVVRISDSGSLVASIRGDGGGVQPVPGDKRVCFAYGGGSSVASWDGLTPTVDASTPTSVPAGATKTYLNFPSIVSAFWIFRRLRIWRGRKLTTAQVQKQSARST